MLRFADTSVVVRYLTGDPPDLAERAARLIEGPEDIRLTDIVLAETTHVLRRVYRMPREAIADLLVRLLRRRNVTVHGMDNSLAITALLLTRPSGRVSVPDALIWAVARSSAPAAVFTFDRRFPAEDIQIREPV